MRVSLSVLGAAKTESGYNTRCKSFCSAMIGACAKWAALRNRPENNFRLWGRWKFNLPSLNIEFYGWKMRGDYNGPPMWFSGNQLPSSMTNTLFLLYEPVKLVLKFFAPEILMIFRVYGS